MLMRKGMAANHKRMYRLYRKKGLAIRIRQTAAAPLEWHINQASTTSRMNIGRWI